MKLRIAFSMSVESCVGIFEENCIEFVDWFWFLGHIKYFFFFGCVFFKTGFLCEDMVVLELFPSTRMALNSESSVCLCPSN